MCNQSYLVAAIGSKKAVLAQCFASNEPKAISAVEALFVDTLDEQPVETRVIDTGAKAGTWIEGSPSYIRKVINQGC